MFSVVTAWELFSYSTDTCPPESPPVPCSPPQSWRYIGDGVTPASDAVMDSLAMHMVLWLPAHSNYGRDFLEALKGARHGFDPTIQIVPVKKLRIQYELGIDSKAFIVELAEVKHPAQTWSIEVESENLPEPLPTKSSPT